VHFILIKPVLSDHLSYVTIFHCSFGRSHKTGLTVITHFCMSIDLQLNLIMSNSVYLKFRLNQKIFWSPFLNWVLFNLIYSSYLKFLVGIQLFLVQIYIAGLDINVCPLPVKTDAGQVDLVSRLSDGTSEKMIVLPFEGYIL
jgi:hypothetical protein